MTEEMAVTILDKLKSGELKEYLISKEEFLSFRKVLVSRKDFKHYRGIAQRGGDVLYQYLNEPRS
ncbi:hypothetical protein R4Z10_14375 [Niallia sp. XMNu-256]|uniref:hypothetical protein n=1 Tax=Niallia sp. XMNu-256 TaxID=3082444 RepID=UPI0030CBD18C